MVKSLDVALCIAITVSLAGCYQLLRELCNIIGRAHDHIRQQTTVKNSFGCATSSNSITSCV